MDEVGLDPMSTAIDNWPIHQDRPGAAADGRDYSRDTWADPNEHSNRYWPVSPETGLEVPPTAPIASVLYRSEHRFQ